jgi:hypothetical protein
VLRQRFRAWLQHQQPFHLQGGYLFGWTQKGYLGQPLSLHGMQWIVCCAWLQRQQEASHQRPASLQGGYDQLLPLMQVTHFTTTFLCVMPFMLLLCIQVTAPSPVPAADSTSLGTITCCRYSLLYHTAAAAAAAAAASQCAAGD